MDRSLVGSSTARWGARGRGSSPFCRALSFPTLIHLLRTGTLAAALPTSATAPIRRTLGLSTVLAAASQPETPPGSPAFFLKLGVVLCLVLCGGALAGLTLALMSQDAVNLTVMSESGDDLERKRASKVLRLVKKGQHWVLVTLLLFNTITNETLPIFLDSILGGGVLAVISSTALILMFGEIIPQAVCSRYGLAIGAASTPFMLALMYISYPLSYPIAVLLDRVLGHDEGVTYKKKELKTFVSLHRHLGAENLIDDEVTIISAVLELSEKSIKDIMVPIDDIYSLSTERILDEDTVEEILKQGYSRVPIYEKQDKSNFIGMLLVKNLVIYDPEDARPVSSFSLIPLPEADPGMSCLEALNFFQQGRSHMLLVTQNPGEPSGAMGIVSLEDVIEELIGEEIIDETDLFLDVANKIKVVRRPQIRTGTAKKLTPLLQNAAARRQKSYVNNNGRRPSRTQSLEESSETSSLNRDYGTLSANAGASTPRRRPSGPHRLGSATTTLNAFDKVKVKGGNPDLRKQAIEAVLQNLEATGHRVIAMHEEPTKPAIGDDEDTTSDAGPDGNANSASHSNGRIGEQYQSHEPSRTSVLTVESIDDHAREGAQDEGSPLLGGKKLATSPSLY